MSKFKVGDVVVRVDEVTWFRYGNAPVEVLDVNEDGDISVDEESGYWLAPFFKLYQPEPEVSPQVEPMQPLVSIYDKALDLKMGVSEFSGTLHAELGNINLREYLCNYLIDSFYGTKEDFEEVTDAAYPVFVTLVKAGYIEGSVTPEGYLREFDFDKAMEFVSSMIVHAFGCSFDRD